MWGPSASGKTALLAQIYLRAQAAEGDWKVFVTRESRTLVLRESDRIERENYFPMGTPVGVQEPITYHFKHEPTSSEFTLRTIDRAGAMYEDLPQEIRDGLRDADAMVLLVDHHRQVNDKEVRDALMQVHLDRDLGTGRDLRPVAICLSKADELIHSSQDYRRAVDNPAEFVRPHLGPELLQWIGQHYANFELFPVSAAGLKLSYGRIGRSVFFDENFQVRVSQAGTPFNHLTPFTWVFAQLSRGR